MPLSGSTVGGKVYFFKEKTLGQVRTLGPSSVPRPRPSWPPAAAAADLSGAALHLLHLPADLKLDAARLRRCGGERLLLPETSHLRSARRSACYGARVPGPGSLYLLLLGRGGLWHGGPVGASHRGVLHRLFLRLAHLRGCHYHLPQSHLVGLLVLWEHRSACGGAQGWCGLAEEEQEPKPSDGRRGGCEALLHPRVQRPQELVQQRKGVRRARPSSAQVSRGDPGGPPGGTGGRCYGSDGSAWRFLSIGLLGGGRWHTDATHHNRNVTYIGWR